MRTIYLDCFAGISGNMFLGALLDLGLPEEYLRRELAKLPVKGYELSIRRVQKQGVSAYYLDVLLERHHHHRHLPDIFQIIDGADLDNWVKETAKKIFLRLAQAEAKVHGTTVDHVHFHEVGAVDAIIDIVGAAIGLHYLQVDCLYTSDLRTGSGFVKCSHGRMPVPAPATAELLQGIPYQNGDIAKELVTPTGAAIVATLGQGHGAMPRGFTGKAIGYGAGTWDLDIPNVVRAVLGEIAGERQTDYLVIEANIDDLNPQLYAQVLERLFAIGVRDAWLTPIIMKKGRPANQLSVLLERSQIDAVAEVVFSETTTIGLRYYSAERMEADRNMAEVTTPWGKVRVKVSSFKGRVTNVLPEYEDCKQLADQKGVPLKLIWQQAMAAGCQYLNILPIDNR